jgi:putative hydroxymethylpyrimidine transport system permease protein
MAFSYDLLPHALTTLIEIILGFVCGSIFGILAGGLIGSSKRAAKALTPFLIIMQALPVFAIAPLLVIWFGFGLTSKLIMSMIIIFFPVAIAFSSGLLSVSVNMNELSQLYHMSRLQKLRFIALPHALPSLLTGLKIAAGVAPIGAIVGEWVGSAGGLGFWMLHANARMQTDQLFAALFMLLAMALLFHWLISEISTLVMKRFYL